VPWRTTIETGTSALVAAMLLKGFLFEPYRIPTGSMQPTLIGDERSGVFDRVIVDKLAYALGDPERWDVAVLGFPLDASERLVKRIAGVGPEEICIRYGDVWTRPGPDAPWRIPRRPPEVQAAMWRRLDFLAPSEARGPGWSSESAGWSIEGRSVHGRGDGRARFTRSGDSVRDAYLDGYPDRLAPHVERKYAGENAVGDVRCDGTVTALAGTTEVRIELTEGPRSYAFVLPGPAAPDGAAARIALDDGGAAASPAPFRLPPGRPVRFAASNLDDRLELEVDGEALVRLDVESAADQRATVSLASSGAGADFDELMVWRDVFYTESKSDPEGTRVPAGSYYVLGDNPVDSSDSREWTLVRYEVTRSDGSTETVEGCHRLGRNPVTVGHGAADGPWMRLRDRWGEPQWFRVADSRPLEPLQAPLVPRDRMIGRAIVVFWPIAPKYGLNRLGPVR